MGLADDISRRIRIVRVLAITLVVIVHLPLALTQIVGSPRWFAHIQFFLTFVLGFSAVPVLSVISGYLAGLNHGGDFFLGLQKRISRIGVPMVFWNGVVIVMALLSGAVAMDTRDRASKVLSEPLYDSLLALTNYPANYPLYFLRDLLMLALLLPILRFFARRYPLPLLVFAVASIYVEWPVPILIRPLLLLFFAIGLICAEWNIDIRAADRLRVPIIAGAILVWSAMVALWSIRNGWSGSTTLTLVGRVVSALALWVISSMLVRTHIGGIVERQERYIFVVFLSHVPVFFVATKLWMVAVNDLTYPAYVVLFFAAYPAALMAGWIIWNVSRLYPLMALVVGGQRRSRQVVSG
jgi:succinoglycan biosynthesis protein ExoH